MVDISGAGVATDSLTPEFRKKARSLAQPLIVQNIYYRCDKVLCEGYERHAAPPTIRRGLLLLALSATPELERNFHLER